MVFRLNPGREVDADGNCLFTAPRTAAAVKADVRELRHRAMHRIAKVHASAGEDDKGTIDTTMKHLYMLDLRTGWGFHIILEIKVLALMHVVQ